jgi:hypothetical protein
MTHCTWLLLQEPPNRALETLLRDLGLLASLPLAGRVPPAGLGFRDGVPALEVRSADDLFDLIADRGEVHALSLVPLPDLQRLHGVTFMHAARHVQVIHEPDCPPGAIWAGAYSHRLVTLRRAGVAPQADLRQRGLLAETAAPECPALLVDPLVIPLDERRPAALFGDLSLLESVNAVFLPPTLLAAPPDSYFAATRQRLRHTLARHCSLDQARPDEPAAVTLARRTDHPLLRDILFDGGGLHLFAGPRGQTRLALHFAAPGDNPGAAFRVRMFREPDSMPGPAWAGHLARTLRDDLVGLAPGGLDVQWDAPPLTWTTAPGRSFDRDTWRPPHGAWPLLCRLRDALRSADAAAFDELVLWPARARDGCNDDHDLAERLFLAHLWRCPWSAEADLDGSGGPWRQAFLDLLERELAGAGETVEERVRRRARGGWPRIDGGSGVSVRFASRRPETVLEWRLLLPLGAVLRLGGTLVLNDPASRLDRGFVLAS